MKKTGTKAFFKGSTSLKTSKLNFPAIMSKGIVGNRKCSQPDKCRHTASLNSSRSLYKDRFPNIDTDESVARWRRLSAA